MPDSDRGDGVDRGVLDPAVSDTGGARVQSLFGQCALSEECARTQERRIRLPVDPVSALGRVAAGKLPSARCDLCHSYPVEAPWQPARDGRRAYSAHAEGAQSDEPATPPCAQRHHRNQWPSDSRCHPFGQARSSRIGATLSYSGEELEGHTLSPIDSVALIAMRPPKAT